ncbi:reverse transcriptase domain-containing protein [Tanacetum coccineum]
MSNFEDSSFHNNNGRRIMSFEIVNYYPWEEIKSSNIDICRAFLKLCVAEDPIWEKITCELEEPFHNTHVDECVCCQVQHMMEENVYALRKEMQEIHASINNDLKGSIAVVDDIARIESHKSSTQHSSVNDFVVINIPEEDVEPKQIILDPDDQPMWESAKTRAPSPNSAIIQLDVDENFVISSTHLKMILENKFDGYLRVDLHDHIREFFAIYDMFKYGATQSEAIKLLIFPFSLCDEAKTWFNELNEESITSWEQIRRAFINKFFPPSLFNRLLLEIRNFSQLVCESLTDAWLRLKSMLRKYQGHSLNKGAIIQIFYHGLDQPTQVIVDITVEGIFLYKSPNQAFQFLEDKVLFKLDRPIKSKNEHHQKSVSFIDGSNNGDNSRLMEKLEALTIKMDS